MKNTLILLIAFFMSSFSFAQDEITEVKAPKSVKAGDEVTVTVAYDVTEKRNIRVFLQLNEDPWIEAGSSAKFVKADSKSAEFTIKVNKTIEPGDNYKFVVTLLPRGKGWPDRLDEWIQPKITVTK